MGLSRIKKHFSHAFHSPFWWLKCLFWATQHKNKLIKLAERLKEEDKDKGYKELRSVAVEAIEKDILGL